MAPHGPSSGNPLTTMATATDDKTNPGLVIDEGGKVKTNQRTLAWLLAITFALAGAWFSLKFANESLASQVTTHEKRLDTVDQKFKESDALRAIDHDILLEIRGDLKAMSRERRAEDRRSTN